VRVSNGAGGKEGRQINGWMDGRMG
jgi:hypothetical protein